MLIRRARSTRPSSSVPGTGIKPVTFLLVREVPSSAGSPGVVGVAGIEPAVACTRNTWPTLSLDSDWLGKRDSNPQRTWLQRPPLCQLSYSPVATVRIELTPEAL